MKGVLLVFLCAPAAIYALGFTYDPQAYYELFGVDYSRVDASSKTTMHLACRLSGAALAGFVILAVSAGPRSSTFALVCALYVLVVVDGFTFADEMRKVNAPATNVQAVEMSLGTYCILAFVALVCAVTGRGKNHVKSTPKSKTASFAYGLLCIAAAAVAASSIFTEKILQGLGLPVIAPDPYATLGIRNASHTIPIPMALVVLFMMFSGVRHSSFVASGVIGALFARALYMLQEEARLLPDSSLEDSSPVQMALAGSLSAVVIAFVGLLTTPAPTNGEKRE